MNTAKQEGVLIDGTQLNHAESGSDLFVGFFAAGQDPVGVRDAFVASTEREVASISVIEQGTYNNVNYRVDLLRDEGKDAEGVYTLQIASEVTGSAVAYVLVAEVAAFSDGVNAVQTGITVDDSPALNGVDPAGMQSFLELAQSTSSQTGTPGNIEVPSDTPRSDTSSATSGSGNTYVNSTWGYTVDYDAAFIDITEGDSDLTIGSPSPLMVVVFVGLENPGVSTSVLYEALPPTFMDSLGPGGTYYDGGYYSDGAIWAGVTGDGYQLMQQVRFVSPSAAVIVTMMADPGTPMNSVGEVLLNGESIFGN